MQAASPSRVPHTRSAGRHKQEGQLRFGTLGKSSLGQSWTSGPRHPDHAWALICQRVPEEIPVERLDLVARPYQQVLHLKAEDAMEALRLGLEAVQHPSIL